MPPTRKPAASRKPLRYALHVALDEIDPPVWRRVWVEDQMTLGQLHHILQAAMGWSDAHLHEFAIDGRHYSLPHPDDDPDRRLEDERKVALRDVLKTGLEFNYLYDFGDSWTHRLRVERSRPMDEPRGAAWVEAGERACPPEDSGGSSSYQEFLDQLKDAPRSKEVKEFLRWAGQDFDPARFDRHAVNAALLRLAWNRWGEK